MVGAAEVRWIECRAATAELRGIERLLGPAGYEAWKAALKDFLCDYFGVAPPCGSKQGKSISPIAARVPHAKGLKVRFAYPGCGKSGGLRIAVLAFCERREVRIAGAWRRKVDPGDADFVDAFRRGDG